MMKIQIDGTNNVNKGAELMFCAICQELERRYPSSTVYVSPLNIHSPYVSNNLLITKRKFYNLIIKAQKIKIAAILKKIGLPHIFFRPSRYTPTDVDILFMANGYGFGDVWKHNQTNIEIYKDYFDHVHRHGGKIVFLPQAFGPFKNPLSKEMAKLILESGDIIFAREEASYNYLKEIDPANEKLFISPDFTPLVKGADNEFTSQYNNSILIIPNLRMSIEKNVGVPEYCKLINAILQYTKDQNHKIVLLNHEGLSDLKICNEINSNFDNSFEVVSGATALEIKGIISQAYAVISSRFHGTSSCLSSGVPCISSSWSSKYELLYKDYGLDGMIVDLTNDNDIKIKLESILSPSKNKELRSIISMAGDKIRSKNNRMWDYIFDKYGK